MATNGPDWKTRPSSLFASYDNPPFTTVMTLPPIEPASAPVTIAGRRMGDEALDSVAGPFDHRCIDQLAA
jgi:hypothetical protein